MHANCFRCNFKSCMWIFIKFDMQMQQRNARLASWVMACPRCISFNNFTKMCPQISSNLVDRQTTQCKNISFWKEVTMPSIHRHVTFARGNYTMWHSLSAAAVGWAGNTCQKRWPDSQILWLDLMMKGEQPSYHIPVLINSTTASTVYRVVQKK